MGQKIDWDVPLVPINLLSYPNPEIEAIRTTMLPTIQTFTGKYINFLDTTDNLYDIVDIAHALGNLCRFSGHCKKFYSVAQHSVLASCVVPKEFAFEALMHDRIEAYMGDMVSPLKHMMPDFKIVEKRLEHDSAQYFYLPTEMSPEVKKADIIMLATEKRDIMAENRNVVWGILNGVEPTIDTIQPWSPEIAKENFLLRFEELWDTHSERVFRA